MIAISESLLPGKSIHNLFQPHAARSLDQNRVAGFDTPDQKFRQLRFVIEVLADPGETCLLQRLGKRCHALSIQQYTVCAELANRRGQRRVQ